jgi:hypothetical protein
MAEDDRNDAGWRTLFDGETLHGWHTEPRTYGALYPGGPSALTILDRLGLPRPVEPELHPAAWHVEDGHIVGQQSEPGNGYGGYLVSDETFGDFELTFEARPDWPADTGVMVRRRPLDWTGFQILIDHREHGSIGGFFGNGLASFSAAPFALRSKCDGSGQVIGLIADTPETSPWPVTQDKIDRLNHACDVNDFLRVWRWGDWNEFRIKVVGDLPTITTWVNGLKVAELDTATMTSPNYDPDAVLAFLGVRGHLAFEVHDNDPMMGESRWGVGARCRWRSIRIRLLPEGARPG